MDKTGNYESKSKAEFNRRILTENFGKTYKVAVSFPSVEAKDLHENFETGNYNKGTKVLAIEKLKSRRADVEKQIKKRTNNFKILPKDAHKVNLKDSLKKTEKVDYMGYDICGNFTAQIAGWFYRSQNHFENGMRLGMTLKVDNKRKSQVFDSILEATDDKYFDRVDNYIKADTTYQKMSLPTTTMIESIYSQLYLLIQSMPYKELDIKRIFIYKNYDKSNMAEYMMTLDIYVYDDMRKEKHSRNIRKENQLIKIINLYNGKVKSDVSKVSLFETVKKTKKVKKVKKVKKTKKTKKAMKIYNPPRFKNAHEIAKSLGIYGTYKSITEVPKGKVSWIKIHAQQNSLCPKTCLTKITNRLQRA